MHHMHGSKMVWTAMVVAVKRTKHLLKKSSTEALKEGFCFVKHLEVPHIGYILGRVG